MKRLLFLFCIVFFYYNLYAANLPLKKLDVSFHIDQIQKKDLIFQNEKGSLDKDFPVKMVTRPNLEEFTTLDPVELYRLSDEELKIHLKRLGQISIQIKLFNSKGKIISGKYRRFQTFKKIGHFQLWDKGNAAGGLFIAIALKGEYLLLEKFLSFEPDAIMFSLTKRSAVFMNAQLTSTSLIKVLERTDKKKSIQIASSLENLVQIYLSYWANKDPHNLVMALSKLVLHTSSILEKELTVKEKGILLGSMLAASLIQSQKIKDDDERRLWVINSTSNIIWALTTFIGVIPIAGSIISATAATISTSVVLWSVYNNKIGIRNFDPGLKEIEGHIEFSILEKSNSSHHSRVEILEILAWMSATIHINGLAD